MNKKRICVEKVKGGIVFACMAEDSIYGVLFWRCGRCGRGKLAGKMRERCKVCRARVCIVREDEAGSGMSKRYNPISGLGDFVIG